MRILTTAAGSAAFALLALVPSVSAAAADDVSSAQTGTAVAPGVGFSCNGRRVTNGDVFTCVGHQVRLLPDRSVELCCHADLGGITTADPTVYTVDADTAWVFARGTDRALYYRFVDGDAATPWTTLGGILTSGPAATGIEDGALHVFARGIDGALWTRIALPGGDFGPWTSLGGILTSDPDAARGPDGGIAVVARGTDAAVWLRRLAGSEWGPWTSMGGYATSGPSIAFDFAATHIAARGGDLAAWVIDDTSGTWSAWESIGGTLTSDPELTAFDLDAGGWDVIDCSSCNPANDGNSTSVYRYQKAIVARGADGLMWGNSWPLHRSMGDDWRGWTRANF